MPLTSATWTSYATAMARTSAAPSHPICCATAISGAILSPGWAPGDTQSCKSNSRTAVALAQHAHSACTLMAAGSPKSVAPWGRGWANAMTRAVATGWRLIAARATPALSTTRHATILATSASGGGAAAANSAIFQVNCASRGRRAALGCTRTSCHIMPLPPGVACTPHWRMGCAWFCRTLWPGSVAYSCSKKSPEDTLELSQHQCFVLPRDVAHQRQPDCGVILVVAEILDPVAIGIKEIHAGGHPVVGVMVQSDALGLKLFVGLFQVRKVLDLHRKVVEAKLPRGDRQRACGSLKQGDVMMHLPTGQKGTRFPLAGDLEPENLGVELRRRRQVLDIKYYMADSLRFCHDASSFLSARMMP